MPRVKKDDGTANGAAVLDSQPEAVETGASAPATPVRYWSPEHESLIVGTRDGSTYKFENHTVLVKDGGVADKNLRSGSGFAKSYYRVKNGSGDSKYQSLFMSFLRRMIPSGMDDTVTPERGKLAIMALFDPAELEALEISRSEMNVDAMILSAINNKKVEGIE